jgi:4-hydroxy-3-methylbut-2-en-1-yl diphosphate reductase
LRVEPIYNLPQILTLSLQGVAMQLAFDQLDTKAFRRSFYQVENYHHKVFGLKESTEQFNSDYYAGLIQGIRAQGYRLHHGDVTIRLAESFGFCWGVKRAVEMAYETRQQFPTKRAWITGEIIHNPFVNKKLREMQVELIPEVGHTKNFSEVAAEDVVIIPGAGATLQEYQYLRELGCTIVDTTCPWVSKVWNAIEKHKKGSYTSVIHGKRGHDETLATSSFAQKYLVLQTLKDAQYVCDYILNARGDVARHAFLEKFVGAMSAGFDPDQDLSYIGIANQTTMLKSETEQIGQLIERTLLKKYGPVALVEHFQPFNTICGATQERQDAMIQLLQEKPDVIIVVGGFNSSNTTHLHQMAIEQGIVSYHIDGGERIKPDGSIQHQPLGEPLTRTENWLPEGKIVIGVTAGASTPDKPLGDAIARILALRSIPGFSVAGMVSADNRLGAFQM